MFKFKFLDQEYSLSLESGEPEVTPFNSGVTAHVMDVYEEVTRGQYFPHADERELALSKALDGDFDPGTIEPVENPKGAIE